jgi:hypothetical protein
MNEARIMPPAIRHNIPARWPLVLVVALLVAALLATWNLSSGINGEKVRIDISQRSVPPLPVPEPLTLQPLAPAVALAINEATPLSTAPIEAALPFKLKADPSFALSRSTASDCLTAAIYYEAGNEAERGQRAVAQVILNRVRHPAYPDSVCGVVYQGSERQTGCQFSFTCDGSLSRKASQAGWARAKRIALEALDGAVEPSVGMATHYHANYVVPYWAPSLGKIATIGTHIFYRWSGYWGERQSFNQIYRGEAAREQLIGAAALLEDEDPQFTGSPAIAVSASELLADTATSELQAPGELTSPIASAPLAADEGAGTLLFDHGSSALLVDLNGGSPPKQ